MKNNRIIDDMKIKKTTTNAGLYKKLPRGVNKTKIKFCFITH